MRSRCCLFHILFSTTFNRREPDASVNIQETSAIRAHSIQPSRPSTLGQHGSPWAAFPTQGRPPFRWSSRPTADKERAAIHTTNTESILLRRRNRRRHRGPSDSTRHECSIFNLQACRLRFSVRLDVTQLVESLGDVVSPEGEKTGIARSTSAPNVTDSTSAVDSSVRVYPICTYSVTTLQSYVKASLSGWEETRAHRVNSVQ